jgi:hypothetical protein
VCEDGPAVGDESVHAHARGAPGLGMGLRDPGVEEDDGVSGRLVEWSVSVWKEGWGSCRVFIMAWAVAVVVRDVERRDGFGVGAAINNAVIIRAPEAGQGEGAHWDEWMGVLSNGRRNTKDIEKALIGIWNEESVRR